MGGAKSGVEKQSRPRPGQSCGQEGGDHRDTWKEGATDPSPAVKEFDFFPLLF